MLTNEQVRKGAEDRLKNASKGLAAAQVELLDAISSIELLKGNIKEKEKIPAIVVTETENDTGWGTNGSFDLDLREVTVT